MVIDHAASNSPVDALDRQSRRWLGGTGHSHDEAVARLHVMLLRAARFEVSRRRSALSGLRGGDHDELARQSAADGLVAVLATLDDFRCESRFTKPRRERA